MLVMFPSFFDLPMEEDTLGQVKPQSLVETEYMCVPTLSAPFAFC